MKMKLHHLTPLFLLAACHPQVEAPQQDFLTANIDTTVSPKEDFFEFANGGWIKRTPIPPEESGWGLGNLVEEDIYARLKKVSEDAVGQKSGIAQKIGDFWQSGMDTIAIEKQGLQPLEPTLKAIQDAKNIAALTAQLQTIGIGCLFEAYVSQDDKNSAQMAFHLSQGGLGMPNRDYYVNTDARTVNIRIAYAGFLQRTLKDVQAANDVLKLETTLAMASRRLADLRDPYKNYHKMTVKALQLAAPAFDWTTYFEQIKANPDSIIVGQPEFFTALGNALRTIPLPVWKAYLEVRAVQASAPYLDSATYDSYFRYTQTLSGAKVPKPRWKRVIDAEQGAMGEALGQLFVKEYFGEKAKQRYSDLIENIRAAFKERIAKLTWMSDSTKARAYVKLAKMTKKVGYPDKWKDFSAMQIGQVPYLVNVQNANAWWHRYQLDKLGKPVDRSEWDIDPETYNAYYNPSNNEIVMTAAGFTIPGMKDEDLDDAFVYGYAGANWIGHEMTHGFDDQGRQFDENGNLRNWWQPSDSIQFAKRAQMIVRQFNEFVPVDTLHVNGSATQGENIADLGGMLLGLDAFKKTDTYKKGEKIAGYTPLQRFFLGYAYGWMAQSRKEALARQVMTDVHAPEKERTNGPVVNVPEFYEAFDVKPGDKMYRPDSLRVRIW
jgi:putative endopeptidase